MFFVIIIQQLSYPYLTIFLPQTKILKSIPDAMV